MLANKGAEIILVLDGMMKPHGHVHRRVVPVRALENQVYVLMANRVARATGTFSGESQVADPFGRVLAIASTEQPQALTVTLDMDAVDRARSGVPVCGPCRHRARSRQTRLTPALAGLRRGSGDLSPPARGPQDVLLDPGRRVRGRVAPDHLAIAAHQEFGEVPLDALGAEDAGLLALSQRYSGCALAPLTSILACSGKLTSYLVEQKARISSSEPGSWWPNWSQESPAPSGRRRGAPGTAFPGRRTAA